MGRLAQRRIDLSPRPPHLAHLKPGRGQSELSVFGRRAVLEALGSQGAAVLEVRVARRTPADFRKQLGAACRKREIELAIVDAGEVSALSREPRHDQGVAARIRLERLMEVESFIATRSGAAARKPARVLALDGITNSQNIGMIVRSAVAAGFDALLWPLVGTPWVNGLVIKSSASTLYECPIIRCESLIQGVTELRDAGFGSVGLDGASPDDLFDYDPPHRALFVVGGEVEGISDPVAELLDARVRIPMLGGVESLNVAVAASLLCFQVGPARSERGA
jgi:23S rRNA (guanosine2251-2'-O)-methyltransferase